MRKSSSPLAFLLILAGMVDVSASDSHRSRTYCRKFEATFKKCSSPCTTYLKQLPEYSSSPPDEKNDAWIGCVDLCLEERGFKASDSTACDRSTSTKGPQEILEIDPVLRGVWTLHATSKDGGKTIKEIQPPQPFARAQRTRIVLVDGNELVVAKIFASTDDNGYPSQIIKFEHGAIWVVHKNPSSPLFVVERLSDDGETVQVTFVITVKQ